MERYVTPNITTSIPISCPRVSFSSKNRKASKIVEMGPKLPKIEKLEAPNRFIAAETKKEGINVAKMAMATPYAYTGHG